jgi:hypothetical protein
MANPSTVGEWLTAGIALGVLAAGVVILGGVGELTAGAITVRAFAAFALGFVVAAAWWALNWLRAHGWSWRSPT